MLPRRDREAPFELTSVDPKKYFGCNARKFDLGVPGFIMSVQSKLNHQTSTKFTEDLRETFGTLNNSFEEGRFPFPHLDLKSTYESMADFLCMSDLQKPSIILPPFHQKKDPKGHWQQDNQTLIENPILLLLSVFPLKLLQNILSNSLNPGEDQGSLSFTNFFLWFHDLLSGALFSSRRSYITHDTLTLSPHHITQITSNMNINQHKIPADPECYKAPQGSAEKYNKLFHDTLVQMALDFNSHVSQLMPYINALTLDESRSKTPGKNFSAPNGNPFTHHNPKKPIPHALQFYTMAEAASNILVSIRAAFGKNDLAYLAYKVATPTDEKPKIIFIVDEMLYSMGLIPRSISAPYLPADQVTALDCVRKISTLILCDAGHKHPTPPTFYCIEHYDRGGL